MIYRTTDPTEINAILSALGIAENIGWTEGFEPPINDDHHYLVVMDGAKKAGLWILHPGEHGAKIHANMLPEHRGGIARKAAREVLDYGFRIASNIYAEIPDKHTNVIRFTREFLKPVSASGGVHLLMLRREAWVS